MSGGVVARIWPGTAPGRTVRGLFECLECGADELEAVSDGEMTNFRCLGCGSCWHYELGWVVRVDPDTCPGCPRRPLCEERRRSRLGTGGSRTL